MKIKRRSLLIGGLLSAITVSSCAGPNENSNVSVANIAESANSASSPANKAKDTSEELALLVPITVEPEEVSWRDDASKPGERKITAVMLFTAASAEKVAAAAEKHGPKQDTSIDVADWYPNELISQSELSDDSKLAGDAYPANDFLQAPFTQGRLIRVKGTDYFVLEVVSK